MALPGAAILLAEDGRLRATAWEDLEHVRVTRAFLTNPASVLAKLFPEGSGLDDSEPGNSD